MTSGLVSDARPIAKDCLSGEEQRLIEKANAWIHAVVGDAALEKTPVGAIDERRSGRVLFIDGPRGAGKTSLLLTLLKGWLNDKKKDLRVLLPILDFDPLPPGMPLHGWLIEPWRKEAERLDKGHGRGDPGPTDLTEQLADLFERAVTGWTRAHAEGKGVVEKALAYQEQASGWLDTKQRWRKFVGAMLCKNAHCLESECKGAHPFVYVVAIDDVDLQVEQLPQLIHAIRLLDHPNVAYVLTGNYEHLRFVLKLDYMRRHEHRMRDHRAGEQHVDDHLWTDIEMHSDRLCDALIEKALPLHARLALPYLTFEDVLKLAAGDKTVGESLAETTLDHLPAIAKRLPMITARQAQHAVDRFGSRGNSAPAGPKDTLKFIADLCGTPVPGDVSRPKDQDTDPANKSTPGSEGGPPTDSRNDQLELPLRGALTTWSGPVLRVLDGDKLKLFLSGQPVVKFYPEFDKKIDLNEAEANRALMIQLLVEEKDASVVAYALEWRPDETIVKTEVEWDPGSRKVEQVATFHWPRLARMSAKEVLELGGLAKEMAHKDINSLSHVDARMLSAWLLKNIEWQVAAMKRERKTALPEIHSQPELEPTLSNFVARLELLWKQKDADVQVEVKRWVRELYVMTAPYFGLPKEVAEKLRKALEAPPFKDALDEIELWEIQKTMVENAITARAAGARKSRQSKSEPEDLSEGELSRLMNRFLKQRKMRTPTEDEERWNRLWPKPKPKKKSETSPDGNGGSA